MAKVYIDVREPDEFAGGHVEGALNIPLSGLLQKSYDLSTLDKSEGIVVYCRSGKRADIALSILRQQGFTNIKNGINQANIESTHP